MPESAEASGSLVVRGASAVRLDALVVDDDVDLRDAIASLLTGAGHRVTLAASAEEAAALLHAQRFDVAALDVRLPKVDGLALFRNLRRDAPATAVILMTAHAVIA